MGDEFGRFGILYEKIPCLGHQETPTNYQVNTFVFKVRNLYFDCMKNGLSILVHCTHGFNRTGFMIISYYLRMQNEATIKHLSKWINLFATSRPPGIKKQSYIEEL